MPSPHPTLSYDFLKLKSHLEAHNRLGKPKGIIVVTRRHLAVQERDASSRVARGRRAQKKPPIAIKVNHRREHQSPAYAKFLSSGFVPGRTCARAASSGRPATFLQDT